MKPLPLTPHETLADIIESPKGGIFTKLGSSKMTQKVAKGMMWLAPRAGSEGEYEPCSNADGHASDAGGGDADGE